MIFLETTQDFITVNQPEHMNFMPVLIVCGTILVLSVIALRLGVRFNIEALQAVGIIGFMITILAGFMWGGLGAITYSNNNKVNHFSYNVPAFQEWASDTYMVDLNDKQATALLTSAVNSDEPYIQNNVYVETIDGSDAIVTLYHDESEWRLVMAETIAVPTH